MLRLMLPVLLLATPAAAQDWYVRADAGVTAGEDENLGAQAYSVSVGRQFGPLRIELGIGETEVDRSFASGNQERFELTRYSVSALYDFNIGERTALFVGAGADRFNGDSSLDVTSGPFAGWTINRPDFEATGWHVSGGASYRLIPSLTGEVQVSRSEAELDGRWGPDDKLIFSTVSIGARYAF